MKEEKKKRTNMKKTRKTNKKKTRPDDGKISMIRTTFRGL